MKTSGKCTITLLPLVLLVVAGGTFAYTGEKLASDTKISIEQARVIALKAYPGKITDEELEQEKGGSRLRYSFDIQHAKTTHEVGVDAKTGSILENNLEGPNPD